MQPEAKRFTTFVSGREVTYETGKLAGQAGGAVTLRLGDSIVFASATMGEPREGIDFFPLTVEYEERMYAGGRIPGSFFRREGRPSTEAILVARLTDRPLRPLFPDGMRNEVQVIMFSLSADKDNPLDILAINAASAAIMISDIPWGGPVGAVRVGRINGEFVINPTFEQIEQSDLDLRMAGTRDAILMVECGASEVTEDVMIRALEFGHRSLQPFIEAQERMVAEIGKQKRAVALAVKDESVLDAMFNRMQDEIQRIFDAPYDKATVYGSIDELRDRLTVELAGEDETL
ncbi:MAG TPA: polyribonucleotide nucleotidyltransferase, partial [Anaerolineaceae bacterium]|nr:polyribonucleotide nucleotidyltransferase [Anaerolineaceae bacterium]